MGRYQADSNGYYWWHEDPEEIRMEPYMSPRGYMDGDGWWVEPREPHISIWRPKEPISEDSYQAILSVLSGETREEWVARREAEGKPITPGGEEKQD